MDLLAPPFEPEMVELGTAVSISLCHGVVQRSGASRRPMYTPDPSIAPRFSRPILPNCLERSDRFLRPGRESLCTASPVLSGLHSPREKQDESTRQRCTLHASLHLQSLLDLIYQEPIFHSKSKLD